MDGLQLNELLDEISETKEGDLAHRIIQELQKSIVILPAVMPADTDPEMLRQMKESVSQGGEAPLPDGANPIPCILEDKEGKKLIPVFTTAEELEKDKITDHFPLRINIPFQHCIQIMGQTDDVRGIVVNPFSHNFRVDFSVEKKPEEGAGEIQDRQKITEEQFHALVRQHVEATLMPEKLFQEKENFINQVRQGGKEYIFSLYKPPYNRGRSCPYTKEDFDVMSLMIRDDLLVIQISLPAKHYYVGTCSKVFLVWNPEKQEAAYYAIVLRKDRHLILHQAFADGTNREISEAPAEGSELQAVIDLHS